MKYLLLMRHGDARSASALNIQDHDRPLAPQGKERSLAIAMYLAQNGRIPEIILSSSAIRCIQTGEKLIQYLDLPGLIQSLPELYNGSVETYLNAVQQLPSQCSTVLLIGHNPTIQEFAHAIRSEGANIGSYECAAITCVTLAIQTWQATTLRSGSCLWFTTPSKSGFLS